VLLGVVAGALLTFAAQSLLHRSTRTYIVSDAGAVKASYLDIPNIFCDSPDTWEYQTHEIKYADLPAPFQLLDPLLNETRKGNDYLTIRLKVDPSVVRETIETSVEHGRVISQTVRGDELKIVLYQDEGEGRVWATAYQFASPPGRLEKECARYGGVFHRVSADMLTGAPIEAYRLVDGREITASSAALALHVESHEH